ncbi:MAG TPA: ornithine cyclodeaminase family protein [Phenylobacterium sp.]|jgi:ornithine cyclodeaminase/alanine dehydrogenase-like protein (mu-crystallin family)|nr:ornithine cyclodeaminase family protein [Phenylobacterium sp.]
MRLIDADEVRANLTYEVCIPVVRAAMIALSRGETRQLLRSIMHFDDGRMFGVMPGAMGDTAVFGAKVLSVFPKNFEVGRPSHQGVVLMFDPQSGELACVAEAQSITAIRTAAASAVATDALARPEARRLAVLGYGDQAEAHLTAMTKIRPLERVAVWGRSLERAKAFAARMGPELGIEARAIATAQEAVADADIICTVSAAAEPILKGAWVAPGTHVNLVGSSFAGPVEADDDLVVRSRFIADYREGVLKQGAEFLKAKQAGLIGDDHVVGEIGEVLAGTLEGRQSADQVTVYKSLGHIVQDLASVQALLAIPPKS